MTRVFALASSVALMLLLFTGFAGAQTTVTFDLTGANSGNLAGVYTSPYTGTINGGSSIPVICDDFKDESYIPETWTAYSTKLSSLTETPNFSSTTNSSTDSVLLWKSASGSITVSGNSYSWALNQAAAYTVAAVLAIDILDSSSGSQAQQDYSYALWELFQESSVASQLSGDQTDLANASSDLSKAITQAETETPANYPNVTIYSYDTGAACPDSQNDVCPKTPPQEFITVTPEPASMFLFGTGLLGIIAVMRRKQLINL
jgi:hypothetical protein